MDTNVYMTKDDGDVGMSCCVANGPRGMLLTPSWAVMSSSGGITINLYAPMKAELQTPRQQPFTLDMVTAYPLDGEAVITVTISKKEKVENFMRILAERYDNNPTIAYLFIGHYGMWGEGHTELTTPKHGHSWGFETQKRMIDLYRRHFKNSTLCISDDYVGHNVRAERFPITDYAFSKGVTIHDDSILVQPHPNNWYHSEMAQLFWPTLPVVLEHEHYGGSVERGAWDEELLLKAVEDYHASFLSIHWWPDVFYKANKDIIARINRRIGYRLQALEIIWPATVRKGEPFIIQSKWANAGVAPCYKGGYPCFTLKDEKGGIVSVLTDTSFNLKNLPVAPSGNITSQPLTSTFVIAPAHRDNKGVFFRACKPGRYELFISVGNVDGTPVYELPYTGQDGHKRYKIGSIVLEDYLSSE